MSLKKLTIRSLYPKGEHDNSKCMFRSNYKITHAALKGKQNLLYSDVGSVRSEKRDDTEEDRLGESGPALAMSCADPVSSVPAIDPMSIADVRHAGMSTG